MLSGISRIMARADQTNIWSKQAIVAYLNAIYGLDVTARHIAGIAGSAQAHVRRLYYPRCKMHRPPGCSVYA